MTDQQRIEKKKLFLEALSNGLGIIETALRAVGIPRNTYVNWRKSDPEFDQQCADIMESQVDFVEGKLLQRINEGDTTAMIFYLKTKGKNRGWTEKLPKKEERPQGVEILPPPPPEVEKKDRKDEFYHRVSVHKEYLIRLLKDQGKYTDELEVIVTSTAWTYARIEELQDDMLSPGYQKMIVQISREGNERMQKNPLEDMMTSLNRQLTQQLTAIGMTTESKERKQDSDNFKDFLEEMKNG